MKIYLFILIALSCMGVFAQNEEAEVQKTIETFFEGFHKQDSIQIKRAVSSSIVLQTIATDKEKNAFVKTEDFSAFLKGIAGLPKTISFEEKITGYTIKIDGLMAHAWTTYEFWSNGKFSHCGVNSFQLFNEGSVWKIIYLIDTRRKVGCN